MCIPLLWNNARPRGEERAASKLAAENNSRWLWWRGSLYLQRGQITMILKLFDTISQKMCPIHCEDTT